jgi:hypothetical protein
VQLFHIGIAATETANLGVQLFRIRNVATETANFWCAILPHKKCRRLNCEFGVQLFRIRNVET